jgi:hypothetical protein
MTNIYRSVVGVVLLTIGPFAVLTGLLALVRAAPSVLPRVEQLAFGVGLFVGVGGISVLPAGRGARIIAAGIYLPVVTILLALWGLNVVCAWFGDCL